MKNLSDYELVIKYKLDNCQKSFYILYKKYEGYLTTVTNNFYNKYKDCFVDLNSFDDVFQYFIEKAFIKSLNGNFNINKIDKNFDLRQRLNFYIKEYKKQLLKKLKKHQYNIIYFDNIDSFNYYIETIKDNKEDIFKEERFTIQKILKDCCTKNEQDLYELLCDNICISDIARYFNISYAMVFHRKNKLIRKLRNLVKEN